MSTEYSQEKLNERFDRESESWRERYEAVEESNWRYDDKLYRRHYTLELMGANEGQILDLGCGAGPYVASLNRLGYQVVAMDAASEMVRLASEETQKLDGNGWALRGDALNLPFQDNSFDALLAVGLLEYLPDDEDFLKNIGRVLKPGGRAVITLRNSKCFERCLWRFYKKCGVDIYRANYWYREHRPYEFEKLLSNLGFENFAHRYCHFYPMTWPFDRILRPVNAVFANMMERKFSSSDIDWMASTYVVAFNKSGESETKNLQPGEFVGILRCPISGGAVSEVSSAQLAELNALIEGGEVKNKGEEAINQPLEAALVSQDGNWTYPYVGKAPAMLEDEAIMTSPHRLAQPSTL